MSESFGHVRAQLISGQVCMVEGILPETTILDLKQKLKAWNPSEDDLTRQLSSVQLVVDGKRFEDDEMVVAAISPTSEVQVVFTNPAVECASQRCCCSWELLDVCIPESVGIIEDHAFNDCSLLLRVSIPKSVRRIGACAFAGCSSLESLVIPDSVTAIGDHAFEGCRSLGDLSLPSVVQSLGEGPKTAFLSGSTRTGRTCRLLERRRKSSERNPVGSRKRCPFRGKRPQTRGGIPNWSK
ncbi:unnamed protein product [Durusdinium trenchii]|uniref:Ubiquitin-like domain-containing protein n=1 Tax=Durusdinium trenchii TaxID=1381693 RepID=A0ABP0JTD1_9DINO